VHESIRLTTCTALEDLGESCRTKSSDLCLRCVEAI
jgi:hypothetical protein